MLKVHLCSGYLYLFTCALWATYYDGRQGFRSRCQRTETPIEISYCFGCRPWISLWIWPLYRGAHRSSFISYGDVLSHGVTVEYLSIDSPSNCIKLFFSLPSMIHIAKISSPGPSVHRSLEIQDRSSCANTCFYPLSHYIHITDGYFIKVPIVMLSVLNAKYAAWRHYLRAISLSPRRIRDCEASVFTEYVQCIQMPE